MRHPITRDRYDAVLFDMDGVITDTVSIHATCWKTMFDEFLQRWAMRNGEPFRAFDVITAIAALEMALRKFGAEIPFGRGVAAAQEVLMEALN